MNIVLVTCGSRGDVQPMLALSLGFQARGHYVLLCGLPEKAAWAREMSCPYYPLGDDVTAFIDGMRNAYSFYPALQFLRFVNRQISLQFEHLPAAVKGADLVIGASLTFALAAGPRPIYAGFGSMPKQDQMRCMVMVVDAARQVGRRLVIARFWPEPWGDCDDPNFFF